MAEKYDEYEKILKRMPQVKISGSGKVSSEEVSISGSGRILGDIETKMFKVSGSAASEGKVKAEIIRVSGSASFYDDVEAIEVYVSGSASFRENVKCKFLKISGSCKIHRDLIAKDYLRLSGSLSVGGNIISHGTLELRGGFKVNGNMDANRIYVDIRDRCEVNGDIRAENIEIIGGGEERGIILFGITIVGFKRKRNKFYTTNIYAKNTVRLENVICNNVEGSIVEIGRGCEIKGKIKYKNEVKIHPEAKISSTPEKIV